MSRKRATRYGGILALALWVLPASQVLACRGKGYEEKVSSSLIQGLPFPDSIEGLAREEMRVPTCYPFGERFDVLYRSEPPRAVAAITLTERDPRKSSQEVVKENADFLVTWMNTDHMILSGVNKQLSVDKPKILSRDVGGIGGMVILAHTIEGTEYKVIHFTLLMPSQAIKIRYSTSDLLSAEEQALAFRNSYLSHLKASSVQVFEPSAASP